MKKSVPYLLLLLLTPALLWSQVADTAHLKLIFAGDIMGHDTQINSALIRETDNYSYDTCFSLLEPLIQSADIATGNLEVTLAGPEYKGYPQFSSPDELAEAIKRAGFDILITANNHSLDRSKQGLERTIQVLDQMGIVHTGTFVNEAERDRKYPLVVEKHHIRLAILNYTYGTNGLEVKPPNIVNYINRERIREDLEKARTAEPDFIIVTIHWGKEYERTENREQADLAAFILEQGADAVIGSHPHVVQPFVTINPGPAGDSLAGKPVVYSLGNFISNQRKRYTDGGIMAELDLCKTPEGTVVQQYNYLPVWVWKPPKAGGGNYFVLVPANTDVKILDMLRMNEQDREKMRTFLKDTEEHLTGVPLNDYRCVISGK